VEIATANGGGHALAFSGGGDGVVGVGIGDATGAVGGGSGDDGVGGGQEGAVGASTAEGRGAPERATGGVDGADSPHMAEIEKLRKDKESLER